MIEAGEPILMLLDPFDRPQCARLHVGQGLAVRLFGVREITGKPLNGHQEQAGSQEHSPVAPAQRDPAGIAAASGAIGQEDASLVVVAQLLRLPGVAALQNPPLALQCREHALLRFVKDRADLACAGVVAAHVRA
jgi:hypothetical protein